MNGTRVVIDTDILSMFAKASALNLLGEFLGKERVAMTPAIRDEISAPMQYGYVFPGEVLSQIPIVHLTEQDWQEYERLWGTGSSLGKGELEAIAFCRGTGALFATNDSAARKFAQNQGVQVISLQAILRGLWVSGMRSKPEVQTLLEHIKSIDCLEVPPAVELEIFGEGEPEEKIEPTPPG